MKRSTSDVFPQNLEAFGLPLPKPNPLPLTSGFTAPVQIPHFSIGRNSLVTALKELQAISRLCEINLRPI